MTVEVFNSTLSQMLMMFSLIAVGFLLRKCSCLPDNAGTTMSKLETFVFVPALNFYAQISKCNPQTFAENAPLILYGTVITVAGLLLAYPLSRLFVPQYKRSSEEAYRRNIYKYAMTFGNYGFMGNFIVLGVFGQDAFFRYTLFCFPLSILCNVWGLYVLIPKEQNAGLAANLKKGLLTPPVIGLVAGMALGLLGVSQYMPDFVMTAFDNAAACQGPVGMLLAGFVIGGYRFGDLISNKKVYVASFVRLIAIPAVLMLILRLLSTPQEIMVLALIAFATPLGLNTIVYPAAYGGETKTGASMAMISHTLSVITIPIMYLLFIEML